MIGLIGYLSVFFRKEVMERSIIMFMNVREYD